MSFIPNCETALTKQPAENNFNGFVVLPYVQGVSEKISRILKQGQNSLQTTTNHVKVDSFESNYHERLFLEAWHATLPRERCVTSRKTTAKETTLDPNAGKDYIVLPEAYKGIART